MYLHFPQLCYGRSSESPGNSGVLKVNALCEGVVERHRNSPTPRNNGEKRGFSRNKVTESADVRGRVKISDKAIHTFVIVKSGIIKMDNRRSGTDRSWFLKIVLVTNFGVNGVFFGLTANHIALDAKAEVFVSDGELLIA